LENLWTPALCELLFQEYEHVGPQTLFLHLAWVCLKLALEMRYVFFCTKLFSFVTCIIHFCSEHYEEDMHIEVYEKEYDMNHKRRGKAVIFNHSKFQDNNYPDRDGTEFDVRILDKTYDALGFEVEVYPDFKRADIENAIAKCKFKQGVLN